MRKGGRTTSRTNAACRRGFTLVELLVVIGVLGILLSLLAPALRSVRRRAGEMEILSNLRDTGVVFEVYAQIRGGEYPYWPAGEPMPMPSGATVTTTDPWALRYAWPVPLQSVAPWSEHYATWIDPANASLAETPPRLGNIEDKEGGWPIFEYSNSFVARPIVWSDSAPATEEDLAPTHTTEVSHPSSKVLLFDARSSRTRLESGAERNHHRVILMADGSASMRRDANARAPANNQLRPGAPRLYHDTPMGVLGRDF